MIIVSDKTLRPEDAVAYATGPVERKTFDTMMASSGKYTYDSPAQLQFELQLRKEIVAASRDQARSGLNFAIFRKSKCNSDYWERTRDGGFRKKPGVKSSDAINDIYRNGSQYATECATAMMIVYYKALLAIYPEELFNRTFRNIDLMNWHRIDSLLQDVGSIQKERDYFPGDRRYFANPDVDPLTPEWQGENTIDLGDGTYYGHGIGIEKPEQIIQALNENRIKDADDSAYLLDSAGRPDFDRLYSVYHRS